MQISSQHLAELLIGIARAQAAVARGLEKVDQPGPTLVDLPLRLLLDSLRGAGPDAATVAKELERLCAGATPTGGPGGGLDFNAPPP